MSVPALHLTNGDTTVPGIRAAAPDGRIVPWRDVLHDGPVPTGLPLAELSTVRAAFIIERGWGDPAEVRREFAERDRLLRQASQFAEVVLWFEHDLYDQLQLIQLLAFFADERPAVPVTLVQADDYLGVSAPDAFPALFADRRPVSDAQYDLGRRAWAAFRGSEPTGVAGLLEEDTGALPHLAPAFRRHLEQFPSVRSGLSRSEQAALEAIATGAPTLAESFRQAQAREERVFLGDASYAAYLEELSGGAYEALVLVGQGEKIVARGSASDRTFWNQRPYLTDVGRAVLAGEADRVNLAGIDRWLGGVRLSSPDRVWRYDRTSLRLIPPGT